MNPILFLAYFLFGFLISLGSVVTSKAAQDGKFNCDPSLKQASRSTLPGDEPRYIRFNNNARVEAQKYRQPNTRSWSDYRAILYMKGLVKAPPNGLVLDVGAGYGVAALQAAVELEAKAVIINTQDNWAELRSFDQRTDQELLARLTLKEQGKNAFRVLTIAALGIPSMEAIAASISTQPFALFNKMRLGRAPLEEYYKWSREFSVQLREAESRGQVRYLVGYAEELLPQMEDQIFLLTDVWGAFSYSPERVRLLENYYNALTAHGEARIFVSGVYSTYVLSPDKERMSLIRYLTMRYPDIFSVEQPEVENFKSGRILIIKKRAGLNRLSIGLEFFSEPSVSSAGDFSPPTVLLKELRSQ